MLGEPDIYNIAVVFDRLPHIRYCKKTKLIEVCDLPDHVVAHADVVQDPVHLRDSALYFVKGCHRGFLLSAMSYSAAYCRQIKNGRDVIIGKY